MQTDPMGLFVPYYNHRIIVEELEKEIARLKDRKRGRR